MVEVALGVGEVATSWRELRDVARVAEEQHFAAIVLPDHPNAPGLTTEVALAALAAVTTRLRLWPNVLAAPYRSPSMLAKTLASIDVVCDGRLDVGLGTGWDEREFEAYGFAFAPKPTRDLQLIETIQITRALWTESRATFEGTTARVRDAVCEPAPVQQPHPPIWVGSLGGRRTLHEVVAPYADGCNFALPFADRSLRIEGLIEELARACERVGRDPSSVTVSTNFVVAGTGADTGALEAAGVNPDLVLPLDEPAGLGDRVNGLADLGVARVMLGLRSHAALEDTERLARALQ